MLNASVILPTYNQRERLEFTLDTLQNQRYDKSAYEIIVVDDGSTDSTSQYLSTVRTKNLTIVKLNHNRGRSYARNQGIKAAKSDILIFSDSDRILPSNFVNSHLEGLYEHSVSIGCVAELFERDISRLFSDYNDNKSEFLKTVSRARLFNYYEFMSKLYDSKGLSNNPLCWCSLFSGNFCIHKSDLDVVGPFDESFVQWGFENFELGYRLFKHGYSFRLNRESINFHLYHERDRIGEERDISHKVFLTKYADESLEYLPCFLDGDISLEEFQSHMTGAEVHKNQSESFFRRKKFGSKVYGPEDWNDLVHLWWQPKE